MVGRRTVAPWTDGQRDAVAQRIAARRVFAQQTAVHTYLVQSTLDTDGDAVKILPSAMASE
jgi:hypothetical protein